MIWPFQKHKAHPRRTARFISYLSNYSLLLLIVHLTLVVVVISAVFALVDNIRIGQNITYSSIQLFLSAVFGNFAFFFGADIDYPSQFSDRGMGANVLQVVKSVLRVFVHTYALGGLVFKVLAHSQTFVARESICVSPTNMEDLSQDPNFKQGDPEKTSGWEIRARFYNASKTPIEALSIKPVLRAPRLTGKRAWLKNHQLPRSEWTISLPHVPYSCRVPLRRTDLQVEKDTIQLNTIDGQSFATPAPLPSQTEPNVDLSGPAFLVLQVKAHMVGMGRDFVESLWWDLSKKNAFIYGKEISVDVPAGKKPNLTDGNSKNWNGWSRFEEVESKNFVFGYGSLVKASSLSRTLGRQIAADEVAIAELLGYRRDWNAAAQNCDLPDDRKWGRILDDVWQPITGAIRFANITKTSDPATSVTGAIFSVSLPEIFRLDGREKNYVRVDVTNSIRTEGFRLPDGARVWTYVGTDGARQRSLTSNSGVRAEYYKTIVSGFDELTNTSWLNDLSEADREPKLLSGLVRNPKSA